jgi:hypothetical protein
MNRYFKDIEGFKNYSISETGKIYSKKSNKNIKINGNYVTLYKNGKSYIRSIKKLVENTYLTNKNQKYDSEKFIPILEFENYLIDKFGNIYSTYSKKNRKTFINTFGYISIFLSKEGKVYNRLVHRLVYESWNGKIDDDLTIDHIDENKQNNSLSNLQVLTRSENVLKFHNNRNRIRNIDGFIKIENFENYYINKEGVVISFKYGEESIEIVHNKDELYLRKNNKRYYLNLNNLLFKYFNIEFKIHKNRKYKNFN